MSFILTLAFDEATYARYDALRRRHFPAAVNFLPAHLTLFHTLPEDEAAGVRAAVALAGGATRAFALEFTQPRSLGRGVAFDVRSPELLRLRRHLADAFEPWLTPQDARGFRPHVTVQNKATAEVARTLLTELQATWTPHAGRAEGLLLWRYLGGPWEQVGAFAFTPATGAATAVATAEATEATEGATPPSSLS